MGYALKYCLYLWYALAAGSALAAGLLFREVHEEACYLDHAGIVAHYDEAAGADDRADALCRLKIERQIEVHEEQGYTPEEVKGFLAAGGMEFVRVFDADTGGAPTDTSEKVIFIAREKGKVRENHE